MDKSLNNSAGFEYDINEDNQLYLIIHKICSWDIFIYTKVWKLKIKKYIDMRSELSEFRIEAYATIHNFE